MSTHIYPRFADFGAGRLTKLRAQSVSREACANVARDIGVPERLQQRAPGESGQSAEALIKRLPRRAKLALTRGGPLPGELGRLVALEPAALRGAAGTT